jgi:hypothetical protein
MVVTGRLLCHTRRQSRRPCTFTPGSDWHRRGVLTPIGQGCYSSSPYHQSAVAWLSIAPGPA